MYACGINSITINGIYTDNGNGYFYVSYLNIESKFTLKCDLTVSNIIMYTAELDLGEYTLTTSGYYCRLTGAISDSKTSEAVSIKCATTSQTDIYATLNISYCYGSASISGTATIGTYYGSGSLSVYGTVTISKYISANQTGYYNIYMQEGGSLTLNSVVCDSDGSNLVVLVMFQFDSIEKYPSLYLSNVSAQVRLDINGSVSTSESATETATPANLSCVIATLGSASDFKYISICFVVDSSAENKTSLYSVNANNEIVYSGT